MSLHIKFEQLNNLNIKLIKKGRKLSSYNALWYFIDKLKLIDIFRARVNKFAMIRGKISFNIAHIKIYKRKIWDYFLSIWVHANCNCNREVFCEVICVGNSKTGKEWKLNKFYLGINCTQNFCEKNFKISTCCRLRLERTHTHNWRDLCKKWDFKKFHDILEKFFLVKKLFLMILKNWSSMSWNFWNHHYCIKPFNYIIIITVHTHFCSWKKG